MRNAKRSSLVSIPCLILLTTALLAGSTVSTAAPAHTTQGPMLGLPSLWHVGPAGQGSPPSGPLVVWQLNPDSGGIWDEWQLDTDVKYVQGLAFHGRYLYIADQDSPRVLKVDVLRREVSQTWDTPATGVIRGLAVLGDTLYAVEQMSPQNRFYRMNLDSGLVEGPYYNGNETYTGLDGGEDGLLAIQHVSVPVPQFQRLDVDDFSVIESHSVSGIDLAAGLATIGDRIFVTDNYGPRLMRVDEIHASTFTVINTFETPGLGSGLAGGVLVPEPATLLLILPSLAGLGGIVLKRRK